LSTSNKNLPDKSSDIESEELKKLDKELNDLIDKNESLKKGITKLFNEIEKDKTNTNKPNN